MPIILIQISKPPFLIADVIVRYFANPGDLRKHKTIVNVYLEGRRLRLCFKDIPPISMGSVTVMFEGGVIENITDNIKVANIVNCQHNLD